MSRTKRAKNWHLFVKESKPYRKTHWRAYRKAVRRIVRTTDTAVVAAMMPEYRRTSGWLTW